MNKFLLLVAFITISTMCYAQTSDKVTYGFRTGLNYSTIDGTGILTTSEPGTDGAVVRTTDFSDLESRIGFHASFFANIALSDSFSLQPEIGVSALGSNEREVRLDNGDFIRFKTNWLQVNLLAKIDLGEKLFIQLGPQAAVNVGERDNNDYYNYDFAAVAGLGYNFNENFALDVRYGYGLNNIFDSDLSSDALEANNRYFQLGLAYKL